MKSICCAFVLYCCFAASSLSAQDGFEVTFGQPNQFGRRVFELSDGHYLMFSIISSDLHGVTPVSVRASKISSNGALLWQKNIPGLSGAHLFAEEMPGGLFRIGSFTDSPAFQFRILTLDAEAEVLTETTIGHPGLADDFYFDCLRLHDGGLAVGFPDYTSNPQGVRILKYGPDGNLVFNYLYPIADPKIWKKHLAELPDGRIVAVCHGNWDTYFRFFALSPDGNLLWNQSPIPGFHAVNSILEAMPMADGNLFYSGRYLSIGSESYTSLVFAINPDGNLLWLDTLADFNSPEIRVREQDPDGNILTVSDYHVNNTLGSLILKFAPDGTRLLQKEVNFLATSGLTDAGNAGDMIFAGIEYFDFVPGGSFDNSVAFVRLTAAGEELWRNHAEYDGNYNMVDIIETQLGNFVFCGAREVGGTINTGAPRYGFLARLTPDGKLYKYRVNGCVQFDANTDCVNQGTEQGLGNWVLKATSAGVERYAVSTQNGNYSIGTNDDSITVEIIRPNDFWESCQTSYPISFSQNDTVSQHIPVQPTADCPFLEASVSTWLLRRCFENTYTLHYCNTGTVAATGLTAVFSLDSLFGYVSSDLPVVAQNGNEYTFDLGDLAVNECKDFHLKVEVSCDAALGQTHCLSVKITAANKCSNESGIAESRECRQNTGSYDPNEIKAFLEGQQAEGIVSAIDEIEYHVDFQNTGTDTAFSVVVVDTLPDRLDPATVRPGAASHGYEFSMYEQGVLHFTFRNILLPDSTINEPASHGFVKFKVKPRAFLPLNTDIYNSAAIYFDKNLPVITNLHWLRLGVTNTKEVPVQTPAFFPNPALPGTWCRMDAGGEWIWADVFGTSGQKITSLPLNNGMFHIPEDMPAGHYYIKALSKEGFSGGGVLLVGNR